MNSVKNPYTTEFSHNEQSLYCEYCAYGTKFEGYGKGMGISMNIIIKPQGTAAIYEQIVNQMKNAIITGELSAGEALPSIRALAASLEVSVITTKKAYEVLENEKLIRGVAGKGFYVCEYNPDYLKEKRYIDLEKRLEELLEDCKKAGMKKQDIIDIIETLME